MLKLENLVMDLADWQQNYGITLSETQIEKQGIKHQMTERVSPIFYISNLIIKFTLFPFIIRDFLMFLQVSETREFVRTAAECKELLQMHSQLVARIKDLQNEKKGRMQPSVKQKLH